MQETGLKARVLVVDDDQMIVSALTRVLSYEGYAVIGAPNGEGSLALLAKEKPDLVILDVAMPGMSGIDVCKRIKSRSPSTPVLFLSARDEVPDRVKGLESGGDDYLVKPFAFEELVARIEALLRRRIDKKPAVLQFADLTLDTTAMSAWRGDRKINLSTTEYRMLHCFMSHPNQILSKETLLERVWGYGYFANLNIIEVYVRYLRNKLEQDGGSRLIHTMRGAGYLLKEDG